MSRAKIDQPARVYSCRDSAIRVCTCSKSSSRSPSMCGASHWKLGGLYNLENAIAAIVPETAAGFAAMFVANTVMPNAATRNTAANNLSSVR